MELKEIVDLLLSIDKNRILTMAVLCAVLIKRYIINGSLNRFFAIKEKEICLLTSIEKQLERYIGLKSREERGEKEN